MFSTDQNFWLCKFLSSLQQPCCKIIICNNETKFSDFAYINDYFITIYFRNTVI